MRISHSQDLDSTAIPPVDPTLRTILDRISEEQLREWVTYLSQPRHFTSEETQNRAIANWLSHIFSYLGFSVDRQGPSANIVAFPSTRPSNAILVGAHYDSVPHSPGADDNASAVAAMLACASALATAQLPLIFVAFNREEDGFIGSQEFVAKYHPTIRFKCAHILEMVGYASSVPGSQQLPTGLPIQLPSTGDFLGLLSNENSAPAMQEVLQQSRAVAQELPVIGLQVIPRAERVFPVLARSDHAPFWKANIPAVMWTDTAEFRNPHYHKPTDTPDTLDYTFLHRVTTLLTASVHTQASALLNM
jgi:Zn-dependent M28 family amino/carboxypeptidase